MNQTIAICHTPGGAGGIAVILLTGPRTRAILGTIFTPRSDAPVAPGRLVLGEIRDADRRLDEAIVTLAPDPDDATRATAELNIHGGPRVTQRVLQRLEDAGAVVAPDAAAATAPLELWPRTAPGRNNPAIGDELLAALPAVRTAKTLAILTHQWAAGISELAERAWRLVMGGDAFDAAALAAELRAAGDAWPVVRRLLNPPEVVLAGPPNAGKSSLANSLLGRRACIVTDTAGTTRDWVRELADLAGRPVWLTDTAGLWSPADPLDAEAVRRAWARIDGADVVVAVFDAAAPPADTDPTWRRLLAEPNVLPAANKTDVTPGCPGAVGLSTATGDGVPELAGRILGRLGLEELPETRPAAFTDRQHRLLNQAADAVNSAEPRKATAPLRSLLRGHGRP